MAKKRAGTSWAVRRDKAEREWRRKECGKLERKKKLKDEGESES